MIIEIERDPALYPESNIIEVGDELSLSYLRLTMIRLLRAYSSGLERQVSIILALMVLWCGEREMRLRNSA